MFDLLIWLIAFPLQFVGTNQRVGLLGRLNNVEETDYAENVACFEAKTFDKTIGRFSQPVRVKRFCEANLFWTAFEDALFSKVASPKVLFFNGNRFTLPIGK